MAIVRNVMTLAIWTAVMVHSTPAAEPAKIDFNRDIRPILSNTCYKCHGPDGKERQADLRLDTEAGALAAGVREKPDESELVLRITSTDPDERMPPIKSGKKLTEQEIQRLTEWVKQGAPFARHWSYVKPVRPELPKVPNSSWIRNEIDHFILARLDREGVKPSPEADRYALIRRVSLDLTGLPPTIEEVRQFVNDRDPNAYEHLVDRLLKKDTYGEHWARMWLDLARYADSAGYADDPARTIWAFRDYVIKSLNDNKPFDQFTLEQIAGDLLPNPTEDQLMATAFHRNTLTNNEGGTNDEEFRNVAIVDRVNTTMAVWMGTTIACAQCHSHKFDPITQEEYFRFFAIFNNSEDADRRDESPLIQIYTDEQQRQKVDWTSEIAKLEQTVQTATPALAEAQARWETKFGAELNWHVLKPGELKSKSGAEMSLADDGSVLIAGNQKTDVYSLTMPLDAGNVTAIRLETLPHDSLPNKGPGRAGGNFVVSRVLASITPPAGKSLKGRYVRIEIPGKEKILSLAEVQVFSGSDNVAMRGEAKQSTTAYDGPAKLAIDGNTNGHYTEAKSTTHTAISENPWWEVDLKSSQPIDRIVIWNRTDNKLQSRLANFRITVLNDARESLWEQMDSKAPDPSSQYTLSGVRGITFAAAYADFSQQGFDAGNVLNNKDTANKGWAISPQVGKPHWLTLIPSAPVEVSEGSTLTLTIEQLSKLENHTIGRLRIAATSDAHASEFAKTPAPILAILKTGADKRSATQQAELLKHYLSIAPELKSARDRLASVKKQLADMKPSTTLPVMRELPKDRRRKTNIQHRGNFLDVGKEVTVGLPAVFHAPPDGAPINRLTLAKWLVDENNPLTARVIVNRYWEQIFGVGIVRTSEEFGSQGELPLHPELLDWLATEFVKQKWDMKHLLKLLVTSAAYRQSSRVTPELFERDPKNRLLARGPRIRLSAEMIRDQALFVSGLLSLKMYGPPARPPQPNLGINAAFGSGIDWKTSDGEDRYRRGLYTTWRRSNPYPSMAAFDAPNREVCTIRRDRTNTPLQALVTLNDPVYFEAAQALARRMADADGSVSEKVRFGFRVCLARDPSDKELERVVQLYEKTRERFTKDTVKANSVATQPRGPLPEGTDVAEVAAWTLVGNVLLNLDEMFMKR